MESIKTSSLAGQIDPSILPNIYLLPVSDGEPRSWHQSGGNNLYWGLFEKILECQGTSRDELPQHLLQSFQNLSFHEQLTSFELSLQLTADQRQIRWQIAVDTLSAIRGSPEHRNCDATVFGSLVTGISNPDSGIDLSIDMDGDNGQALESKAYEEKMNIISDFGKSLESVLKNAASPYDPALKLFSDVRLYGRHFKLIWLRESKTGIRINVSLSNKLCIRETKLIQFYNKFEPKTKQLIIFLSYWAKVHRVCETNKLTRRSMTILVLVFLMEKNMIPSVLLLQAIAAFQRSERGEMNHPDTRDSYFCDDREVISKYFSPAVVHGPINTPEENAKAFINLLTDFFRRVAKTRFSTSLVSPQLGRIVLKEEVVETASNCVNVLPTEMRDCWRKLSPNYFLSSNFFSAGAAAVIQDPFEIDDNTAKLCTEKGRDEFVSAAKHTLSLLSNNPFSLSELFVRRSDAVKRKFSAIAQRSVNDKYFSTLLDMILRLETEGESRFKENAATEILRLVRDISEVPDGLFMDPDEFDAVCPHWSKLFLDSYMTKLYKWNMLGSSEDVSSWQIQLQVIALWGMFAKQYLEDFFTKGLILPKRGVTMISVDVICPISSEDMWTYDDTYAQKKISYFRKINVKKVNPAIVRKPRHRIRQLSIPEKSIKYGVIEVKVTYPFWKRKYEKQISDLDGEADVSEESYKEHLSKPIGIVKEGSRQATDLIPFSIYALYKLDSRADEINQFCAEPKIIFAVQELNEGDTPQEVRLERMLARKCVMEIFQRTFKTHLLHKLAEWSTS